MEALKQRVVVTQQLNDRQRVLIEEMEAKLEKVTVIFVLQPCSLHSTDLKADEQSNALQRELEENEGELRNCSLAINALKQERLVISLPGSQNRGMT